MDQPFSYIIKVFYLVPLVCHEGTLCILTEANRRGHVRVLFVLFAVSSYMKCKTIIVKTLLDSLADIHDGRPA
jgi:hypothetical protein